MPRLRKLTDATISFTASHRIGSNLHALSNAYILQASLNISAAIAYMGRFLPSVMAQ